MSEHASETPAHLIALDVGNTRVKWGRFAQGQLVDSASLPLDPRANDDQADMWNLPAPAVTGEIASRWCLASVNPLGSDPLLGWLRQRGETDVVVLEDPAELPLRVDLEKPQAVGIDRLLNAVAVNARRPAGQPALVVDAGSAITVDAVSENGAFLGGAIAVGLGMGARALHEFTYWLPLLEVTEVPVAIGKSTPEAMRSGLFWGVIGSIHELLRRQRALFSSEPCVYLTGGDAATLAPYLDQVTELVPNLTLQGIHLSWQHVRARRAR